MANYELVESIAIMQRLIDQYINVSEEPKGAKSTFDQNRVINITTLFSLPPTF